MTETGTTDANKPDSHKAIEHKEDFWGEYHHKMVSIASWFFRNVRRSIGNDEDAVNSAFRTHFRRERLKGNFRDDDESDDIWPLLKIHLVRKIDKYRKQPLAKKNQGIRMGDLLTEEEISSWKEAFVDKNLSLEDVEQYINAALRLLDDVVDDPELREVASLKLQAYSSKEISNRISGLSEDAVDRKLARIRYRLREAKQGH